MYVKVEDETDNKKCFISARKYFKNVNKTKRLSRTRKSEIKRHGYERTRKFLERTQL